MVTTALASGICPAAARIAAPPRLWPIRIAGAFAGFAQMIGGAHEIGDVRVKVELAKSPSLEPRPVKSNRSTAMPLAASAAAIRFAASTSLPQVKQCANSA